MSHHLLKERSNLTSLFLCLFICKRSDNKEPHFRILVQNDRFIEVTFNMCSMVLQIWEAESVCLLSLLLVLIFTKRWTLGREPHLKAREHAPFGTHSVGMIFEIPKWRCKVHNQTGLFGALKSTLTFWMVVKLCVLMRLLREGMQGDTLRP